MSAYYNEIDAEKCAWLRELIKQGVITDGEVDCRPIQSVAADDVRGFQRAHWFAGIGVWDYALNLAGWGDEPVWTGSCPCPSFSAAGKGQGFADPRHLWPYWDRLIGECRPPVVFGEQVEAAIGHGWLDLVQAALEDKDYAVGKAVLCSAGVGGSDIRQRLYFIGLAHSERDGRRADEPERGAEGRTADGRSGEAVRLADPSDSRCSRAREHGSGSPLFAARSEQCREVEWLADPSPRGRRMLRSAPGSAGHAESGDEAGGLADSDQSGRKTLRNSTIGAGSGRETCLYRSESRHPFPDALKGYWRDADWLLCTDGRWRPVEAGTFPLADGAPCRLGRLRGYGDAINAQVAAAFIEACRK